MVRVGDRGLGCVRVSLCLCVLYTGVHVHEGWGVLVDLHVCIYLYDMCLYIFS